MRILNKSRLQCDITTALYYEDYTVCRSRSGHEWVTTLIERLFKLGKV